MLGSLKKSMIAGSAMVATLLFAAPTAHANVFTFTGVNAGGTLNATATITTNNGSITVVLSNTLAIGSLSAQNQAVSDLTFDTSTSVGTVGALTASGQQGNVSSTGVVTYVAGTPCRFIETCGTVPPNGTGDFS